MNLSSLRRSLSKLKSDFQKKSGGVEWYIKMQMHRLYGFPKPPGKAPDIEMSPELKQRIQDHMDRNKKNKR